MLVTYKISKLCKNKYTTVISQKYVFKRCTTDRDPLLPQHPKPLPFGSAVKKPPNKIELTEILIAY